MFRTFLFVSLIGISLVLATSSALGQTAENAPKKSEELVVGDWYDFTIERHGVKESLRGHLIKVTDDWIVLGSICCERESSSVPWIGAMPYVGRFFTKEKSVYLKVFTWVPRQDAKVGKRTTLSSPSVFKPFVDDRPTLEKDFSVCWVENNKRLEDSGRFSDAAHRKFQVTRIEQQVIESSNSHSTKFPVVGATYTQDSVVNHKVTKEFSLNEVLFVRTQIPIDASQANVESN